AIHAALRVWNAAPTSLLVFFEDAPGRVGVYGTSEGRPFYSAEFAGSPERALAVSRSELRLPPDHASVPLEQALPVPCLAGAAAIAASTPFVSRLPNLLPAERRASSARRQYLIPVVLAALLLIGMLMAFVIFPAIQKNSYLAD